MMMKQCVEKGEIRGSNLGVVDDLRKTHGHDQLQRLTHALLQGRVVVIGHDAEVGIASIEAMRDELENFAYTLELEIIEEIVALQRQRRYEEAEGWMHGCEQQRSSSRISLFSC